MKKFVFMVIVLLVVSSLTAISWGKDVDDLQEDSMRKTVNIERIGQTSVNGNYKVTDYQGDDIHPRIAQTNNGTIVVVYEKIFNLFSTEVPLAYSIDKGVTWKSQISFNSSTDYMHGTGQLVYPDIAYNSVHDVLFLSMCDPIAIEYNNEMWFIPAWNLPATYKEDCLVHADSSSDISDYQWARAICTDNFFLSLATCDEFGISQLFQLGYFLYPSWKSPEGMHGRYYDSQSLHESAPATNVDMGYNDNLILIVCETATERGPKITLKWNVKDEALMISREQENSMDKYADIEQYHGIYLADGTDPDVSGSGNNICVVYIQGGDIKCSYTTCLKEHENPGFNWQTSVVATDASTPAVYMTGNIVLCAYVKDGNLYLTKSTDAGATWGAPVQKNNGGITVLEDVSSIDLSTAGIVFTDTRNGNKEIYYTTSFSAPSKPIITGPTNGKPHKNYIYTLRSVDQENSSIWYFVDWGDGQTTNWDGPYESGTDAELKHTYTSKATFTIKAKAKNTNDIESGWATLTVTMPYLYNKQMLQISDMLFQRFPNAFPLLRQQMGY